LPAIFVIECTVRNSKFLTLWTSAAILLLMFGLAVTSMAADSPTFDEQGFLVRGLAYLRGEDGGGSRLIRVGHPLGLNALNATLLVADPTVRLPSDHPSWTGTDFHRPAELFLWEIGNDVEHVMFLARLPTVWLGVLLAAICGRWATEMGTLWAKQSGHAPRGGRIAGLVALCLIALDPNVLAHTRLATTDLGLAAAAALAGFTLWRFLRQPSWMASILAGLGIGLLLNTKFTALLFLPLFALVIALAMWEHWRHPRPTGNASLLDWALMLLVVLPAVAFITLWAGNGFDLSPLASPLPLIGQFDGRVVPLASYLDQLLDIGNRLEVSTPSYLLGRYSDSGWWTYFPVAFLLKTPLPALLLLFWSIFRLATLAIRQRGLIRPVWFDFAALFIPAAGYFLIALTTDINLGYRHILPILPFLFVLIGVVTGQAVAEALARSRPLPARILIGLVSWLLVIALWIYPHFLAYFNAIAGGPGRGWRALVDSNIDWGQDLGRLADWLAEKDVDHVWLSYFGEARPEYYGINYTGLDSFPPRLMNPLARPFYPHDPAPGWYAISATTLQGVHFANHDQFRFFRGREPSAKIGYSIFLFEQPARGEPADLLLTGVQLNGLAPDDFTLLGTNDVTPRWFDGERAIILPDGARPVWLALGDQPLHPLLRPYLAFDEAVPATTGEGYRLYQATPQPPQPAGEEILLHQGEEQIAFIGAPALEKDGGILTAVTAWRLEGRSQPVKIFVHLLDESGELAAQWDGLDAAWEGWREGDTLIHTHAIDVAGLSPGDYRLVTGLYNPESLQRWQSISGADLIELGAVTVLP
jgi:hypothetical protein